MELLSSSNFLTIFHNLTNTLLKCFGVKQFHQLSYHTTIQLTEAPNHHCHWSQSALVSSTKAALVTIHALSRWYFWLDTKTQAFISVDLFPVRNVSYTFTLRGSDSNLFLMLECFQWWIFNILIEYSKYIHLLPCKLCTYLKYLLYIFG